MNKQMLASLILLTTILCSCEEDEYRIVMRPCDEGLERKLTVGRCNTDSAEKVYTTVPQGTLAALAQLYPERFETANPKIHGFVGTFTDQMPNDVGGAGTYKCLQTPLGSTFLYVERFRGNDRPGETLQETFHSADRLTDRLIGWLKSEFGRHKEFSKLQCFMDQDFRKDIKNLSTYFWLGSNESRHIWEDGDGQEKAQMEIAARAFQYLFERDYLAVDDLSVIMRTGEQETFEQLAPPIRKLLTKKVMLADQKLINDLMVLLTDPERLEKSLRDHFAGTDEYKKRLKEHKKAIRETEVPDSTPEPPDPLVLLEEAIEGLVQVDLALFGSDDLHVELWTGQKPVATNGRWEEQQKRIVWTTDLTDRHTDGAQLPEVCYAVWCEPDGTSQGKHFGKTVLVGEDLVKYCVWYKSLSEGEAAEWDGVVEALSPPDEDSFKRLEAFKFSDERAKPAKPSYAQQAIELIKDALERKQE